MNQDQVGESSHLKGTICFFQGPRSEKKLRIHFCHRAGAVHPGPSASASISLLDSSAMAPLTPSELPVRTGWGWARLVACNSAAMNLLRWTGANGVTHKSFGTTTTWCPGALGEMKKIWTSIPLMVQTSGNITSWYGKYHVNIPLFTGFQKPSQQIVVCSYCW